MKEMLLFVNICRPISIPILSLEYWMIYLFPKNSIPGASLKSALNVPRQNVCDDKSFINN